MTKRFYKEYADGSEKMPVTEEEIREKLDGPYLTEAVPDIIEDIKNGSIVRTPFAFYTYE